MWKLILSVMIISAGLLERSHARSETLRAIDIISAKLHQKKLLLSTLLNILSCGLTQLRQVERLEICENAVR